jgi:putative oxidoreductase
MITRLGTIAARSEPVVYAALRAIAGSMFAFHGVQKIIGWYATRAAPAVGSQAWLGGLIELVAGSLIALGLFTRAAAFLASGTMAVAYFQFHWKLNLAGGMWIPNLNKGELALLYSFVFLFIWARGAGAASLDQVVARRRN